MKAREIPVSLPHPALMEADWGDCFEVVVSQPGLSAEQAARQAFETMPAWSGALLAVRNLLVRPFGLKGDPEAAAAKAPRIGMFPIVAQSDREMVLGFDDRHLDFRIVVETEPSGPSGSQTAVRLMTLVKRHNRLGRIYLAAIMPFHKLIVAGTLTRVAR